MNEVKLQLLKEIDENLNRLLSLLEYYAEFDEDVSLELFDNLKYVIDFVEDKLNDLQQNDFDWKKENRIINEIVKDHLGE